MPSKCSNESFGIQKQIRAIVAFLSIVLLSSVLLTACQTGKLVSTTGTESNNSAPSNPGSSGKPSITAEIDKTEAELAKQPDIEIPQNDIKTSQVDAITFKTGDKSDSFKIYHTKAGGTVTDHAGKVIVAFVDDRTDKSNNIVKVNDGSGKLLQLLRIVGVNVIKLEDENQRLQFVWKFESDGHFKLKDAQGNTLYKIKDEPYGIKIEDDAENLIGKVRVKEGKISLKNSDGEVQLFTKTQIPPPAMACFSLSKLSKFQQYALAYSLMFLRL